ncbi:hypothetical protein LJC40_02290 [Synergistaceae bacterium OttesenSCG-928-D05]|nr:hypothetical protein [Synergistaceae bacterium OttesenSCG-928-D05]
MIDHWWVTRPKRRLNSIPETLATFAGISLDQEWHGQRDVHLSLEEALEEAGIKRIGERRDHGGGGARTYYAWLLSLGLIFTQESTGQIKLTLAGEAILAGDSPVRILTNQILKYQFPSAFSIRRGVAVSPRFRIRPFRFLLKLLSDQSIGFLTEEEIANVVIVEAIDETDACYSMVKNKILQYRESSNFILSLDFADVLSQRVASPKTDLPYNKLRDTANTFVNWIEYTQLALRSDEDRALRIIPEKRNSVRKILSTDPPFIDRPEQQEYFQRKFGVDPNHQKDTRNLSNSGTITPQMIMSQQIKHAFISEALITPVIRITSDLVDKIADQTGLLPKYVEESLLDLYPHGAIGAFMSGYFEMAFRGRDEAVDFEKATVELFQRVFGFTAEHIGPKGLTPDVLIISDSDGYCAILDNKAYGCYTITNDHRNRMIHNYINGLHRYYRDHQPLAFFSYIAGGFGKNIDSQIKSIADETSINGSAISVSNMIRIIENQQTSNLSHQKIRDIFSINRQVLLSDIE